MPKAMLKIPAEAWITRLTVGRRLEMAKGRLMKMDTIPMLITEPRPNTKMYSTPAKVDSMLDSSNSIKAALPASPWIVPTR